MPCSKLRRQTVPVMAALMLLAQRPNREKLRWDQESGTVAYCECYKARINRTIPRGQCKPGYLMTLPCVRLANGDGHKSIHTCPGASSVQSSSVQSTVL